MTVSHYQFLLAAGAAPGRRQALEVAARAGQIDSVKLLAGMDCNLLGSLGHILHLVM